MDTEKLHVAIVASPGLGHLTPVLLLGNRLATHHNIHVTVIVVTTQLSTAESQILHPSTAPKLLNIVQVPHVDISGLIDANTKVVTQLSIMMRETRPRIRSAISAMNHRPDALIVDLFGSELLPIAEEFCMPRYIFVTSTAWFVALTTYCQVLDKEIQGEYVDQKEPLKIPGCRPVHPEDVVDPMLDRSDQQYREYIRHGVEYSMFDGILMNTWEDLEPTTIQALRNDEILQTVVKVPVYPIGPLSTPVKPASQKSELIEWLDTQPSDSVMYVSFGSGGTLPAEQVNELARGLEQRPVSISRYHSAPSVLGITALLHDHAEPNAKEASHSMTMSPASSVSSPELAHICKAVQPSTVSNLQLPPLLFPLEATTVTGTAVTRPHPPPTPPHHLSASESSRSLLNHSCGTLLQVTGQSSSVPPLPSLPGSSLSFSKWNSVPAPSPSPHASSSGVDSFSALPISPLSLPVESTTGMKSSASSPLPPHIHSNLEPLHSLFVHNPGASLQGREQLLSVPPAPPPPPSFSGKFSSPSFRKSYSSTTLAPPPSLGETSSATPTNSMPPPPPLPTSSRVVSSPTMKNSSSTPPPPPSIGSSDTSLCPIKHSVTAIGPPPPPLRTEPAGKITTAAPPPPPPPPPSLASNNPVAKSSLHAPPVPPPLAPFANGLPKAGGISSHSQSAASTGNIPPIPGPPFSAKGRLNSRTSTRNQGQSSKKTSLKPYHWLKLTRAMQGSLWAEAQKSDEASKAPEFDMSELESLFSANVSNSDPRSRGGKSNRHASGLKSEKVNLIDLRRAYNCEIMLTKVKIPLPDLMSSVLALDDSALDIDQVDNLIKFCPTKEEMELLKNYKGDKENLGKCEQFFLELMKVPRVEAKLRVFSFKIQFCSQVSDLRKSLNIVNSTSEEVRNSVKLMRIMQTILSLGNALNHGTARGSAVGFRLDSLLKLTDTRARNNKLTLMHYLCKVLAEKLPELIDFPKDLVSLEASTKIQLKYLAEEMQAISKGLEKIVQELAASENDGPVSENFCKILKEFLGFAEAEVRSLASLYSVVGRNADALALYFGEDPARCPFEQVVSTLLNFVRMFERALEENRKQLEFEKKKAQKEAENEKEKLSASRRKSEVENRKASDPESKHLIETQ